MALDAERDRVGRRRLVRRQLGYADQSHFSRDFTAMIGEPPTRYAQRYPTTP